MTTYPAQFESDVVLRTGQTLRIRPVRAEDRPKLLDFYSLLSPESLHARFFDLCSPEQAIEHSPACVDYDREFGVVGERDGSIVAVAHYFTSKSDPTTAEVAFAIADSAQDCGIGTKLLESLIAAARVHGIARFEADLLPDNRGMRDVFENMGFNVSASADAATTHVTFLIAPTPLAEERAADRSQLAATASMRAIFAPRSIAVIGASRRRGQLGNEIVRNLRLTHYRGALYVVNPNAQEIEGIRSFDTLQAIDGNVELAIVAVPAPQVESVIDDCVAKHVAAAVIITAGFSETGEEGRARERRLLEKARAAGMRLVGPNCMGVINTASDVRMHATFSSAFPPRGNVAMSSQSGALGLAVLDYARSLDIGFSTFISVGNKVDVSGNDLIQYWSDDSATSVILLYLESFGNPRKFVEIARRVSRRKPIVAVKAGRSIAGARAASSHTGALAASDNIVDELFRQSGVIRTDTLEEMFDVAALLANQPLPRGNRVAIVTNAGGPGILAADACEANRLVMAELSGHSTAQLRELLPRTASIANPIDMIASASAAQYRASLDVVLADPNVDSVLAIYIPVLPTQTPEVAAAIRQAASGANGKTILATFMSAEHAQMPLTPVPAFPFPERAVRALAAATRYSRWREQPAGDAVRFEDIDRVRTRAIVNARLANGGGWLEPLQIVELLDALRIRQPQTLLVQNANDAMEAAIQIGFPVALKAYGPDLLHKSDAGAVRLSLRDEYSVCVAYEQLAATLGPRMAGAVVQTMAAPGVEMMIGATLDPTFGPVLATGAGGALVELLHDVAFRLAPLTTSDPQSMLAELRCAKLLQGFRGSTPVDIAAFTDAILRVSALLELCPEIRELDINPIIVTKAGVTAVDARVRVNTACTPPPSRRVSY